VFANRVLFDCKTELKIAVSCFGHAVSGSYEMDSSSSWESSLSSKMTRQFATYRGNRCSNGRPMFGTVKVWAN
jgi:hypothetical protein